MNTLRNVAFFVLCFALGLGGMSLVMHYWHRPVRPEGPVTGVGAAPAWHGFEAPAGAVAEDTKEFLPLHATAVAVEYAEGGSLTAAVKAAHDAGLKVVLMPAMASGAATQGAGAAGGAREKDPYPRPLAEVAAEAQGAGVEGLCVSDLSREPDEAYWRKSVAEVRKVYKGKVILGMAGEVVPLVTMWDAVDDMGIIGPVRLPRRLPGADLNYTVNDARVLWAAKLNEWESVGLRSGKEVMLLNMRMAADAGSLLPQPGTGSGTPPASEQQVRETFYEGLLTETKGRAVTVGLFLPWKDEGSTLAESLQKRIEASWGSEEKVAGTEQEEAVTEPDDVGG